MSHEHVLTERTSNRRTPLRYRREGTGHPLVYLHPAEGLVWDPFLQHLSRSYEVFAPEFPGMEEFVTGEVEQVESLAAASHLYLELFDKLGIRSPILVGQSFGGLLSALIAALSPSSFDRVVLLDPVGLHNESYPPVADWAHTAPDEMPALLFFDVEKVLGATTPEDRPEAAADTTVSRRGLPDKVAVAGGLSYPHADAVIRPRLADVTARVLLIWGRQDRLVPHEYGEEWRRLLTDCTLVSIDECGHIPQVERTDSVVNAVEEFL